MKKLLCLSSILFSLTNSLFSSELTTPAATQLDEEEQRSLKPRMSAGGSTTFFNILRLGPNQGVYLLGETHDFDVPGREINRRHLQVFLGMLLKAEAAQSEKKYHVLVEHSVPRTWYKAENEVPITFLTNLYLEYQKQPFRYCKVENCEVRRAVSAPYALFDLWPQLMVAEGHTEYYKWRWKIFKEVTGYEVHEYTFNDVIREFEKLHSEMEGYRDLYDDPLIKAQFQKSLDEATKLFFPLRTFIETGGCITPPFLRSYAGKLFSPDETLFDFCCGKSKYDYLPLVNWFNYEILHSTSNFLDLKLFHRILQLRKEEVPVEKIIIFSGEHHSRNLYFHLLRSHCATFAYGFTDSHFVAEEFATVHMPLAEAEAIQKKRESWCVLL